MIDLQQWEDISSLNCQCSNMLASVYYRMLRADSPSMVARLDKLDSYACKI